ncbi:NUDIX hydrolase [Lacticaseibacillus suihuaensis]
MDRLTVQLPDGTAASREVVRTTGAAGVLAQSGERVLFVRQWRTPLGQETLELPAGRIEPGEAPLATAKRELNEEAQLAATNWQYLARVAQSAGFSDATITLYSATGLHRPANQRPQDVGEAVAGEWLTLAEALAAQAQGVICDAKTVIGLLHWQLKEAQHV